MKKKKGLKLKPLHYEAIKCADSVIEPQILRTRDMTPLFEEELRQRIRKGNLVNIQIRGEQTSGKSLVGFVLFLFVNSLLKRKVKIEYLCPDQLDFINKARDSKMEKTCLLIDEWNELSTTGYNATTAQAQLTQFNEVQAQRFLHKICCSPEKVIDPTARIRLDVIDKEPTEETTTCFVSYVITRESITYEQMLGYVTIDVSEGLKHPLWAFYKQRKFKRIELLNSKGIIDSREGDDSEIILKVVEQMRDLAIVNGFVNRDIVRSFIKYVQEKFTAISIYGEDKLTGTIFGILTLLKSIYMTNIKISKLEKAIKETESKDSSASKHYKEQLKVWKDAKAKLARTAEISIHYHEGVVEALKQFAEIGKEEK